MPSLFALQTCLQDPSGVSDLRSWTTGNSPGSGLGPVASFTALEHFCQALLSEPKKDSSAVGRVAASIGVSSALVDGAVKEHKEFVTELTGAAPKATDRQELVAWTEDYLLRGSSLLASLAALRDRRTYDEEGELTADLVSPIDGAKPQELLPALLKLSQGLKSRDLAEKVAVQAAGAASAYIYTSDISIIEEHHASFIRALLAMRSLEPAAVDTAIIVILAVCFEFLGVSEFEPTKEEVNKASEVATRACSVPRYNAEEGLRKYSKLMSEFSGDFSPAVLLAAQSLLSVLERGTDVAVSPISVSENAVADLVDLARVIPDLFPSDFSAPRVMFLVLCSVAHCELPSLAHRCNLLRAFAAVFAARDDGTLSKEVLHELEDALGPQKSHSYLERPFIKLLVEHPVPLETAAFVTLFKSLCQSEAHCQAVLRLLSSWNVHALGEAGLTDCEMHPFVGTVDDVVPVFEVDDRVAYRVAAVDLLTVFRGILIERCLPTLSVDGSAVEAPLDCVADVYALLSHILTMYTKFEGDLTAHLGMAVGDLIGLCFLDDMRDMLPDMLEACGALVRAFPQSASDVFYGCEHPLPPLKDLASDSVPLLAGIMAVVCGAAVADEVDGTKLLQSPVVAYARQSVCRILRRCETLDESEELARLIVRTPEMDWSLRAVTGPVLIAMMPYSSVDTVCGIARTPGIAASALPVLEAASARLCSIVSSCDDKISLLATHDIVPALATCIASPSAKARGYALVALAAMVRERAVLMQGAPHVARIFVHSAQKAVASRAAAVALPYCATACRTASAMLCETDEPEFCEEISLLMKDVVCRLEPCLEKRERAHVPALIALLAAVVRCAAATRSSSAVCDILLGTLLAEGAIFVRAVKEYHVTALYPAVLSIEPLMVRPDFKPGKARSLHALSDVEAIEVPHTMLTALVALYRAVGELVVSAPMKDLGLDEVNVLTGLSLAACTVCSRSVHLLRAVVPTFEKQDVALQFIFYIICALSRTAGVTEVPAAIVSVLCDVAGSAALSACQDTLNRLGALVCEAWGTLDCTSLAQLLCSIPSITQQPALDRIMNSVRYTKTAEDLAVACSALSGAVVSEEGANAVACELIDAVTRVTQSAAETSVDMTPIFRALAVVTKQATRLRRSTAVMALDIIRSGRVQGKLNKSSTLLMVSLAETLAGVCSPGFCGAALVGELLQEACEHVASETAIICLKEGAFMPSLSLYTLYVSALLLAASRCMPPAHEATGTDLPFFAAREMLSLTSVSAEVLISLAKFAKHLDAADRIGLLIRVGLVTQQFVAVITLQDAANIRASAFTGESVLGVCDGLKRPLAVVDADGCLLHAETLRNEHLSVAKAVKGIIDGEEGDEVLAIVSDMLAC